MATWNLIDFSELKPSHCYLPVKQRRQLYISITQRFRISKDNHVSGDITDNTFACKLHDIPWYQEFAVICTFYVIILLYFVPILSLLCITYLVRTQRYFACFLFSAFLTYLALHRITLWRNVYHNRLYFSLYNYFSYKLVYHSSVKDYISRHLLCRGGNADCSKYSKPVIFISIPHAIIPFASVLSPVVSKDILNKPTVGCIADVVRYLPVLRNLTIWNGAISASKPSIMKAISKGCNIGIVPDGIAGMFVQSDNTENVLLLNRKGIAKLALQTGCNIVPIYGFGNTLLYKAYFDSLGIMKFLSRKLKISLIAFSGRFFGFAPFRVPLYLVMGKMIQNPNDNIPIGLPSQQQIDDLHSQILRSYTELFDQHKEFYGWKQKKLQFV